MSAAELFKLTPAQDKAMDCIISDAMNVALGGGSRCVSGDTVLDGHTKTIAELAEINDETFVLTSHGWQWADAPFLKGRARLIDVTTEGGRRIEVTPDHLFWDGSSWVRADSLRPGSPISVAREERTYSHNPLATSSGRDLSRFLSGALRLMRILADYLGDCSIYHHRYDQRPHLDAKGGQAFGASQSCEPAHNHWNQCQPFHASQWRESDNHIRYPSGRAEEDIHFDLLCDRQTSTGGSPWSYPGALSSGRAFSRTFLLFRGLHQGGLQSLWRYFRKRSFLEQGHDSPRQLLPSSYLASFDDTPIADGYALDKVSTITETAEKDYYTINVPHTEQYFANGFLNHNSGKTFLLVRAIILRALKSPGSRHAVFRFRFNACKQSIVLETLPKVMSLCFPGLMERCTLDKSDWFLTFPNGSEIWFSGLDDKERVEKVLGKEYATIYFNECSQIPYQSVTLALTRLAQKTDSLRLKAYYDFNPPSKKHWTYLIFVDRKDPDTKRLLRNADDYSFYLINPYDNKENLDPKYLALLESMPEKTRNRFLLGRFSDDTEGALWTDDVLAVNRILNGSDIPDLQRIVVAVDPSGCSGEEDVRSDEVGIVVAGLGTDGHGYVLEDLTGRHDPATWADIAKTAYERHRADCIVAEKNYGGAMVEHTIHTADPDLPYREVTATRGKVIRAEPISALYNQGKVHHIGYFPEMEDQLCSMTTSGYMGLRSPDRADAAIWALTELFPGMTESDASRDWSPPPVISPARKASRYARRR